ncbi:short-chain dehydrogenase [Halioglobus sp. HI00S01]|uniref:SDR family NAD(P)-dependent oxidoreductase n=1 Tax=Halioglobus sp. HI00S01 TaxID=1822214 RepID=UPI0007C36A0C|nr:SDR family NAD(P)-dependent oxidoreductase [Halioglobus sp. HI00S01]KZX58750.1 short-chain dehydrogenase [Halioglobus sp. HI00S01]
MTTLREIIRVNRTPDEAFAYVADFTTTAEWDSTVRTARKLTDGPVGVGTRFLVNCKLPVGSVDLCYEILEFQPPERLVLVGHSRLFTVEDTITFAPKGEQTDIVYQAAFEFSALLRSGAAIAQPGLQRMGKASVEGLRAALEEIPEAPDTAPESLSGLASIASVARFSKLGYRRAKGNFAPMSADIRDRHIVLTGATAGLGLATARDLAARGAHLTLVIRNAERGEALRETLTAETGNQNIRIEVTDLSLLGDTQALVNRLRKRGEPIDVLINNAGALFPEHGLTEEGHERSTALLLLSPWMLTLGLHSLLAGREDSRVINVVSGGMYTQRLSTAALQDTSGTDYSGPVAYAQAKRALMIVTQHWAEEWVEDGITVNAMHPGWADTPGVRDSLPRFHRLTRRILRTPEEGADTIIWQAVAPEAAELSGELLLDRQPQPLYLNTKTREDELERQRLMHYLDGFRPQIRASRRRAAP